LVEQGVEVSDRHRIKRRGKQFASFESEIVSKEKASFGSTCAYPKRRGQHLTSKIPKIRSNF